MLTINSLGKRFDARPPINAIEGLDLALERGQFVAIVGRSGSGKSTLLGMLGGISRPTSGKILIDGVDQWKLSSDAHCDFRNQKVGFVFQFASLLPTLRIIDNVALPALVGGTITSREAYSRARALLKQVGLGNRIEFYPHQLSGGEQRRAAIARALINSPELLLADEPTADLDEETEKEILNLLIDIQKTLGLTMVVVTHNMDVAARADRVLKMQAGRIVTSHTNPEADAAQNQQPKLATPEQVEKVRRIFDTVHTPPSPDKTQLGDGFDAFIGRLAILMTVAVSLLFLVNFGISQFEQSILDKKAAAHQALEELAMNGLRAEVKDITFGSGKSYIVNIYLKNTGERPIYVLAPSFRGFVQLGSNWLEVPLKPISNGTPKVLKITSTHVVSYEMEPNVDSFTEIIPYYMHVRLSNEMLISPDSQPKDELFERTDNYYVYLKPHNANDADIMKKLKFPGAPPIWIPMPPH